MTKNWVAYVGPFNFPWGQACSRRVYGNARTFMAVGYDVVVASGDAVSEMTFLEKDEITGASLQYIGLGELIPNAPPLYKVWQYIFKWGEKTVEWLSSSIHKPKFVVLYSGLGAYAYRISNWCRQNNIPVIADVVEWFDPRQMMGGRLGPFYASANLAMHYFYPRFDGIIAISSLLEQHFQRFCPTVRIPPTLEFHSDSAPIKIENKERVLHLVYAGTPGKKDELGIIVSAILKVKAAGVDVKLTLIGPTVADLKYLHINVDDPVIQTLGRIPQLEVLSKVQEADFSILIREPLRFANAGFSTKFVESMFVGTPVIANETSDIGKYLIDANTGFLVEKPTVDSLYDAIIRAAKLPTLEKSQMQCRAFDMAKKSFSVSSYAEPLADFLHKIQH